MFAVLPPLVAKLQNYIARACHIPEEKQVLLISGGESLDPTARVSKYHSGTDTNPIFLFNIDIQSQVEGSLLMPPAYETVVSRAQLALQIQDVDKEELRACEHLVHDQHLQQQGWAAVVANLEDITSVGGSLQLLSKIPVLQCLLQQSSNFSNKSSSSSGSSESGKSLLDWISSQDPQHSLQDMIDQCLKATEQLDQSVLETLTSEVQETFKQVHNPSMKEVKGLEDRLYGLDQIMSGAKNVVREQSDMAQGFVQNQNRVSNLRDKSILPDLCSSHKKQLVVMVTNHKKLREIKKKCKMAKEELSINLHTRLRWVMFVEKKICDVDGKLMIYHENLKRLRKRLDILKQVHDAPNVYGKLVIEVCRRKKFSTNYSKMDAPLPFDQNLPDITMDDINMLKQTVPELEDVLRLPADIVFVFRQAEHTSTSMFSFSTEGKLDVPPLQKVASLGTSEIEIIRSNDEHLLDKERSTISLGDQVANCEPETNIVIETELVIGSHPKEKPEFLMPKSLSEALTKEMQTEDKGKVVSLDNVDSAKKSTGDLVCEQKLIVGDVTLSSSSGEQIKSTESDVSGHDIANRSVEEKSSESNLSSKKRSVKMDMSPDMETSQEFTTADFYIEESLPSSIADSPPNKPAQVKPDSAKLLEQKTSCVENLEKELEINCVKLNAAKSKIEKLKGMLDSQFPSLKMNLKEIKSSYISDRDIFLSDLTETKKKLLESIQIFDSCIQTDFKDKLNNIEEKYVKHTKDLESKLKHSSDDNEQLIQEISTLKEEFQKREEEYQTEISALKEKDLEYSKFKDQSETFEKELYENISSSETKINSLTLEISRLEKELLESKQKYDSERLELEQKITDIKQKGEYELEEVKKQNSLEMEVELDRLRAEFQVQLDELESNVKDKEEKLIESGDQIKMAQKERIHLEEMLTKQYQKEKEDITKILEETFKEKFDQELQEEVIKMQNKSKEELDQIKSEIETQHKEELDKILNELQENFNKEKIDEILNCEIKLKEAHKKLMDETMQKIDREKELELQKQNEELSAVHARALEKCQNVLNEEIAMLKTELKVLNDKEFLHQEIQTEKLDIVQGATQTEKPESFQKVAQTDIREVTQGIVQTDQWQGIQGQTQTDKWEGVMGETQTDKVEVTQMETQTSIPKVNQGHVQTDDKEISEKFAQTDKGSEGHISREEHEQCMKDLEARLKGDKQHELEQFEKRFSNTWKTGVLMQVMFNEAVTKVSQEKDKIIDELKQKEAEYLLQQKIDKEMIEKLTEEKSKLDDIKNRAVSHINDKDRELSTMKKQLDDELALKNQQIAQYQQQLESVSQMQVSSAPSVLEISHVEGADSQTKISELEGNDMTMSASTRSVIQDKVSITSCNIGDLVLFCLDERHDHYIPVKQESPGYWLKLQTKNIVKLK
ncbi:hypothetical protein KUTeg_016771, partial [Tegillarca granosa]